MDSCVVDYVCEGISFFLLLWVLDVVDDECWLFW